MEKLKLKKLKRKRDRAKKRLLLKEKEAAEFDQLGAIPPPPSAPYPFCHPGILYQVCPQYAGEYFFKRSQIHYNIHNFLSLLQLYMPKLWQKKGLKSSLKELIK